MVRSLLALSLLLGSPQPDFLQGFERREARTGPLYWRGWSRAGVEWVERFLPEALGRVERRLARSLESRPFTTVLVDGASELARIARALGAADVGRHTRGVAFPGRELIVVRGDLAAAAFPGDPVRVTLAHELAHLVIHHGLSRPLPRWLDEGIAMWVSREGIPVEEEPYLSLLARTGGLYPLRVLEASFPREHFATSVAYQESYLLVSYLAWREGDEGLRRLLDLARGGGGVWEAVREVASLGPEELEREFFAWVAARYSLVRALLSLVNVWTLVGLLAVAAVLRHVVRKRRGLARLAREEGPEEEGAGPGATDGGGGPGGSPGGATAGPQR